MIIHPMRYVRLCVIMSYKVEANEGWRYIMEREILGIQQYRLLVSSQMGLGCITRIIFMDSSKSSTVDQLWNTG
jgi:hypothetical protein